MHLSCPVFTRAIALSSTRIRPLSKKSGAPWRAYSCMQGRDASNVPMESSFLDLQWRGVISVALNEVVIANHWSCQLSRVSIRQVLAWYQIRLDGVDSSD